jgi:uncharacterized phage-like protein YoqJ
MIVAFTGHRQNKLPNKETGYNLPNPTYIHVCQQLEKTLLELKPDEAISGMALGVDSWAANICYKLGIPFVAAIPFVGQEKIWPEQSQKTYHKLLKLAKEVVIVCEGGYEPVKMQRRNEWMCNRCDTLIAVYNGDKTGGTANCINYAKSINKNIIYINPVLSK